MLKSRKKMLLSSIAMLLVALIALGSATFAWYFTTSSVTAKEATMSASAAEGLEIRKGTSGTWGNTIDLDDGSALSPAAIDYATGYSQLHFGTGGKGTAYGNGELDAAGTTYTDIAPDAVIVQDFYVRSTNGSKVNAKYAIDTITSNSDKSYINYVLYKADQFDKAFCSGSSTSTFKLAPDDDPATKGVKGEAQSTTALYGQSTVDVSSFEAPANTSANGMKFVLVAFADGFNTNCKSNSVYTQDVKISLTFSKTS
jgi:hypothetical protein